ncbi:hypothetical protein R3P38DRAFT_3444044 [Favolaschia claudopus]|uniref:Uncharacterized protein n=1 Tax=Favolaschia claudopus TaxID=2862362 RepID=A0AAV9ZQ59_9AGAR
MASSSTQEPPDEYEWCYCDHTCGMHGKPVKLRTLQKHRQRTKDNEAVLQQRAAILARYDVGSNFLGPSTSRSQDLASSSQHIDGSDNDDDTDQDARMTSPDGAQEGGDDDFDAGGGGDYDMDFDDPTMNRTASPNISSDPPHHPRDENNTPDTPPNIDSPRSASPDRDHDARSNRGNSPNNPDARSDGGYRSNDPDETPDMPQSAISDIAIAQKFIELLKNARLDNPDELDPAIIERLKNPPSAIPILEPDQRLAVDLFLSISKHLFAG